jgi:hypothetical protein
MAVVEGLPIDHTIALQSARSLGVGLASADRVLFHPPRRKHNLTRRLWASEHFFAATLGEAGHPELVALANPVAI